MDKSHHRAAIPQLCIIAIIAGQIRNKIRLILPHKAADVGKLMAHGGGDPIGRLVYIDVRLRDIRKNHTSQLNIAHDL